MTTQQKLAAILLECRHGATALQEAANILRPRYPSMASILDAQVGRMVGAMAAVEAARPALAKQSA